MVPQMRQGLILGTIVGAALALFLYTSNGGHWISFIMIPIGAIMGAAPWLLKPQE